MEYARTLNFHGALYEVACECRDGARGEARDLADAQSWGGALERGEGEAELVVDVECESGERWSGRFTADYVESLTSKIVAKSKFTRVVVRMPRGDAAECSPHNHEGRVCWDASSKNQLK